MMIIVFYQYTARGQRAQVYTHINTQPGIQMEFSSSDIPNLFVVIIIFSKGSAPPRCEWGCSEFMARGRLFHFSPASPDCLTCMHTSTLTENTYIRTRFFSLHKTDSFLALCIIEDITDLNNYKINKTLKKCQNDSKGRKI
jgi:hypothetical protein